jgi:hypothetical protein
MPACLDARRLVAACTSAANGIAAGVPVEKRVPGRLEAPPEIGVKLNACLLEHAFDIMESDDGTIVANPQPAIAQGARIGNTFDLLEAPDDTFKLYGAGRSNRDRTRYCKSIVYLVSAAVFHVWRFRISRIAGDRHA